MSAPHFFETQAEFRAWLERHASTARELFVGYHKVGTGRPSMTWAESVDEALCVGWIDGVRHRIDDTAYRIRFTPRKKGSNWSAVNIRRVAELEAAGRMTDAGRAAFAARTEARSNRYSYEQPGTPTFDAALLARLEASRAAWAFWEAETRGYRKVATHWVVSAKQDATRERRFAALLAACDAGERLPHLPPRRRTAS